MANVSIIVPIYNPGAKLNKCIKSILKQTHKNIEIILVNDGSTDNSLDICKEYEVIDSRIKIIDKENEGLIKTRRRGIKESTSDYIMFVDSDDYINKHMVERLYNTIINNSCDIVVCDWIKVVGKLGLVKRRYKNKYFENEKIYCEESIKNEIIRSYLYGDGFPASLCAKLYNKKMFDNTGKYSTKIIFFGEDLIMNMEVCLNAKNIMVIKDKLYYYTFGGNTSKYMRCIFEDIIMTFNIQKDVVKKCFKGEEDKEYPRMSFMLLNSYKYALENIMESNLDKMDIERHIVQYAENKSILEACKILKNHEIGKWFNDDYFIEAIEKKDSKYLYSVGEKIHEDLKYKRKIKKIITKFI